MPAGAQLALSNLEDTVQHYYTEGLAASTRKAYSSGQKQFLDFCSLYKIDNVLPVTQDILCYFVAFLGKNGWGLWRFD